MLELHLYRDVADGGNVANSKYRVSKEEVFNTRRVLYLHTCIDYGLPLIVVAMAAFATDWQALSAQATTLISHTDEPAVFPLTHRPC